MVKAEPAPAPKKRPIVMDDDDAMDYTPVSNSKPVFDAPLAPSSTRKANVPGLSEVFPSVVALFYGHVEREGLIRALLVAYPFLPATPRSVSFVSMISLTSFLRTLATVHTFCLMAETLLKQRMLFVAKIGMKYYRFISRKTRK